MLVFRQCPVQLETFHRINFICSVHFNASVALVSDLNECDSDPCQNGGDCHNGDNTYTCSCTAGYSGDDCEIGADFIPDTIMLKLATGARSLYYPSHIQIHFILVWPTSWTSAVGGLFVCLCVRGHVAILLGA